MTKTVSVTRARLRRLPLPKPDERGSKEDRGRVLIVGGSAEVPGAMLLSGVAALRAGAGKLQLATSSRAAPALGVAVPESLVVGLPQSRSGEIVASTAAPLLRDHAANADALLIGPGMSSERSARVLATSLARAMRGDAALILDAAAISAIDVTGRAKRRLAKNVVLTPHLGEMSSLLGASKEEVESAPAETARDAAKQFGAVVVLKGADTWIAIPDGPLYCYTAGRVGLATSGSGDTLAGIIAGLAARGASAETAAVWAVFLHGSAGQVLARRSGEIGFLAHELLAEIPRLLHTIN